MSKDTLIKGTIILAAAAFVARFLGLIQKVPLQHLLGDQGMATFGIAYNVYGMLLTVATAGIPSAISKLVAERLALRREDEAQRIYRAAVWFAAAAGLASATLLYAAAPYYARHIAQDEHAVLSIRTIAPALLIFPLIAIMRGYFQGRQFMLAGGLSQIFEQILRVGTAIALAFALLRLGYDDEIIIAGASAGAVAGAIAALSVMLYFQRKMKPFRRRSSVVLSSPASHRPVPKSPIGVRLERPSAVGYRAIYRQIFRLSIPISVISLTVPLVYAIDSSTVIGLLRGDIGYEAAKEALGVLNGKAQPLAGIPPILAIALSTSAVPVISAAFARRDGEELRAKTSQALRIALLTGWPLTAALTVAAEPVIGLLFSDANGWSIASMLTFTSLFQIMMMTSASVLMGLGRARAAAVYVAAGIAVKLAAGYALAPLLGIFGIVAATALCFIVIMVLNLRLLKRLVPFRILGRRWAGFAAAGALQTAVGIALLRLLEAVRFGPSLLFEFIQAGVVGGAIFALYPFCLFTFRVVTDEDIKAFPAPVRKWLTVFAGRARRSG